MKSIYRWLIVGVVVVVVGGVGAFLLSRDWSPEGKKARHLARGNKYFSQEQYKEAILEYRNVLRFDATNDQAIQNLGLAYYQVGNLRQSYPLLVKTKEIAPDNSEARVKLGSIYLVSRKPKEAQDEAKYILERNAKNFDALLLLAGSASTCVHHMIDICSKLNP